MRKLGDCWKVNAMANDLRRANGIIKSAEEFIEKAIFTTTSKKSQINHTLISRSSMLDKKLNTVMTFVIAIAIVVVIIPTLDGRERFL